MTGPTEKSPLWMVAAIVGVSLLSAPGSAQSDSDAEMSVKEAYKSGMKHFQAGEHRRAVEDFRKALDKKPHPVLYYNLSQSYVLLGEWEKAVKFADMAEQKGTLDEETSAKNRATGAAGRLVLGTRSRGEVLAAASTSKQETTTSAMELVEDTETEADAGAGIGALGWSGVAGAAVGAGLVTGSIIVDRGLDDDFQAFNDAKAAGETERARRIKQSQIEPKQRTGQILLFSGIGVAAAGTGLLVADLVGAFDSGGDKRAAVRISPRRGGLFVAFELLP